MEPLARPHPDDDRQFSLIVVEHFEEIPEKLRATSPYFGLLAAIDFSGDSEAMRDAIERLIVRGLAHFSSWGVGCEALHDLVDRVDIDGGHFDPSSSDVLMTVWNSKQTLDETMWDFVYASCVTERYIDGCKSYVVAAQPKYADRIRSGWTAATRPETE